MGAPLCLEERLQLGRALAQHALVGDGVAPVNRFGLVADHLSWRRTAAQPWKGLEDVEFATLEWVAWYSGSHLLEPLATSRRQNSSRPITVTRPPQPNW